MKNQSIWVPGGVWSQGRLTFRGPCVIYVDSIRANTDYVDGDYKSASFLTYGHVYIIMKMLEYSWAKMPHAKHNCNIVLQVISCMLHKLSFRRFTYGNLVTTSPSSK